MTVLTVVITSLVALLAFAFWRGRQVAIALAGAECPDCRVPLLRLHAAYAEPSRGSAALATAANPGTYLASGGPSTWEIHACPTCERVVTTVDDVPSPVADCPSCHQRSLVVYAERIEHEVVVDEWCDLCGRRVRTTVGRPPLARTPTPLTATPILTKSEGGPKIAPSTSGPSKVAPSPRSAGAGPAGAGGGQVLPFRRKTRADGGRGTPSGN